MKTWNYILSLVLILIWISCSEDPDGKHGDNDPVDSNDYVSNYSYSDLTFNTAITTVFPGDGLANFITAAHAGDIIELEGGDYGYNDISIDALTDVNKSDYILIRAKQGTQVNFNAYYFNLRMVRCSYMIFDGITFTDGGIGIQILNCHHIIFINCRITNQQQEGLQIQQDSRFIDFVNGTIWNTGVSVPKYGEGIYVGTAGKYDSNGDGTEDKYDHTSRVWIENCEIYSTGHGEAINFKGDVSESTIIGCFIHDIAPGTYDQANEGAINMEAVIDKSVINRRNNFVEYCTIADIRGGFVGNAAGGYNNANFNNGIAIFGAGNTIQNNIIKNCSNFGIHGNSFENQSSLVNYLYKNTISGCLVDMDIDSEMNISATYNPNPFSNQLENQ